MNEYKTTVEIRWSDLDPNFHLRHSVYYDWGAYVRLRFLNDRNITPTYMLQHNFGPILFKETCVFKREILFTDTVEINIKLLNAREDLSRWSIKHEIYKNSDTLAAVLTVEGAWMNTKIRKLETPPRQIFEAFEFIKKDDTFEWIKP